MQSVGSVLVSKRKPPDFDAWATGFPSQEISASAVAFFPFTWTVPFVTFAAEISSPRAGGARSKAAYAKPIVVRNGFKGSPRIAEDRYGRRGSP
jgi:hypothetical protein